MSVEADEGKRKSLDEGEEVQMREERVKRKKQEEEEEKKKKKDNEDANTPGENSPGETVNDHIQEFEARLRACEQEAQRKPSDSSTIDAEADASFIRDYLAELKKFKGEGGGDLPILRNPGQWDAINEMRQKYPQQEEEPQCSMDADDISSDLSQPASSIDEQEPIEKMSGLSEKKEEGADSEIEMTEEKSNYASPTPFSQKPKMTPN